MTGEKGAEKKTSRLAAACKAAREDAEKGARGFAARPVAPQLIYTCLALIIDEAEYGLAKLNIVRFGEALKRIMPLAEEAIEACETLLNGAELESALEDVEQERRRKAARRKAIREGGKAR